MDNHFFNSYAYTDFHELNLSWVISELRSFATTLEQFVSINALKYADPIQWNITTQYEKNTIVIDPVTGVAYISVQPVPSGVALTNTDYWTVVFDLGSFVTRAAQNFTNRWEEDTTLTATFPTSAGDWLVWGDVLYRAKVNITAGDTYVVDSNIEHITMEELIGHLEDLTTTDKSNIVAAINELVSNLDSLTTRMGDAEIDISGILNFIGNDILTTTAQTLSGAVNELDGDIDKLTVFVTPEMFGAVGDGVTDDTQAFTDMLSHVNSTNSKICVEAKTYNLSKVFVTDESKVLYDKGIYNNKSVVYSEKSKIADYNYNLEGFTAKLWSKAPYSSYIADTATTRYYMQSAGYSKTRNVVLLTFAGYSIGTGENDQVGKVLEVSPDFSTVYRALDIDVGHGNGTAYCEKDDKWYIASGNTALGIIVINADTFSAEASKLVGDDLAYWAIAYDDENDIFYCQSGTTQVLGSAKLNVFNSDFSVKLHEVTLDQVYDPTRTALMTSQDATLVNGQFTFLYYSSEYISLTTYDYSSGKITNQIVFSNLADEEPEGVFVKDNYIYILAVNGHILDIHRALLNNVSSTPLAPINPYIGVDTNTDRRILSGADLDDYLSYGHYDCGSGTIASTLSHTPQTAEGFDLFVLRTGYEHIIQIMITNNTANVFMRDGNVWSGTWNNWTSANQYAKGGSVSITDGNFAGYITSSGTEATIFIPLPKGLDYISSITISSGNMTLRGIGGYIIQNISYSNLPISIAKSGLGIVLRITDSTAAPFQNVTNNTPISLQCGMVINFN